MKQLSKENLRKLTDAWQAWAKEPESESQRRSRDRLHLVFLCIRYGALRLSEALALNDLSATSARLPARSACGAP